MLTISRIAIAAALIVASIVAGLLLADGGDKAAPASLPPTVKRLTRLLNQADACLSVKAEFSRLPVKPNGPPGTAFQAFGEAPTSVALIGCEALGGYIGYYHFPSHSDLIGAVARHPELRKHETYCEDGGELIIDDIAGYDPTPAFCKKLGFPIHSAPIPQR
jgi:hypothetical protein